MPLECKSEWTDATNIAGRFVGIRPLEGNGAPFFEISRPGAEDLSDPVVKGFVFEGGRVTWQTVAIDLLTSPQDCESLSNCLYWASMSGMLMLGGITPQIRLHRL